MSRARVLLKHALVWNIARFTQALMTFVFFICIARSGGKVLSGQYSFMAVIVAIGAILANAGHFFATTRMASRNPDQTGELLGSSVVLKLLYSFIAVGILHIASNMINGTEELKQAIRFASWSLPGTVMASAGQSVLFASGRMKRASVAEISGGFILMSGGIIGWHLGGNIGFFARIFILSEWIRGVLYLVSCFGTGIGRPVFSRSAALAVSRPGFQLMVVNIVVFMQGRIDMILVNQLRGDAQTGLFSVPMRIVNVFHFMVMQALAVMFPQFSRDFVNDPGFGARTWRTFRLAMAAGTISAGMLHVGAPWICRIFGAQFIASVPVMRLSAWTLLCVIAIEYWIMIFNAMDRQKITMMLSLGFITFLVVADRFYFIPARGALGAAQARLIFNLVLASASIVIARHNVKMFKEGKVGMVIILSAGLAAIAALPLDVPARFIMIIAWWALCVFKGGLINAADIRQVKQVFCRTAG